MAASIVVEIESGDSKQQPHLHKGYWAGSFRSDEGYRSNGFVSRASDIRRQARAIGASHMAKPE